jgi:hypothetical protein
MFWRLFMVVCSTGMFVGCGGDNMRGGNRDRDRPRSASEKVEKKVEKDKDKVEKDKEKVEKK